MIRLAGPIRIAILANGRGARAEIRGVATEADLLGKSFSRAGKLLAAGFAVDKIVRGTAALVETGGAYVETLSKVQAITKSSQAQINAAGSTLESQASQYGKMGETAGDAADGLLELTKAGLSLKKSLAAVYPTMVLAKSGGLEVADASSLVANTLNTFSLKASKAADIANYLANAADISSADVSDLAESFKYVAPLAAKSGVSLAQTNAVLAELANSGVQASNAGTGFRKFLASLQAPVGKAAATIDSLGVQIYNAQGKTRPLVDIIYDLQHSLGRLTQQQQNVDLRQIFGLTGITSAQIILKQGADGLGRYTEGVTQAGGAARLANASSQGLYGTLKSLRAETITGADAFYRKYSPAVDAVIKANLPKVLDAAKRAGAELLPTVKSLATTTVDLGRDLTTVAQGPIGQDLVGGLKLLVGLAKTGSDALDDIPAPIRQIGIEAGIAALVMPRLAGGVTSATSAVTAQIARLKALRAELVTTQAVLRAPTTGAVPSTFTGLVIPPGNAVSAQRYASSLQLVERQSLNTRAALSKLGAASAGAAGVAGFVALTAGAQQSNAALSTLETTLGAAALGFSAAPGPIGIATGSIAGAAALTYSLTTKFDKAGDQAKAAYAQIGKVDPVEQARTALSDLRGTLDQVTGAYTGATRAAVLKKLQDDGAVAAATKYGISTRTLVNAALGQKTAYAQLGPVLDDYRNKIAAVQAQETKVLGASATNKNIPISDDQRAQLAVLEKQKKAYQENLTEVQKFAPALAAQARSVQAAAAATADYAGKLKGIAPSVRTKIEAQGILPTSRGVAQIAAQYRLLDRKQIKTLISASGADTTVRQVKRVIDTISGVARTKVDVSGFTKGVASATTGAEQVASQGGARVARTLAQTTGKAKANLTPFQASVRSGVTGATSTASSGGQQVGGALQQGIVTGFAGTAARLAAQAAAAVNAAVAAARQAADSHSPSRKTHAIGADMGQGLANGLLAKKGAVTVAASTLTSGLLAALTDADPVLANLQAISDYVSGQFDTALKATNKGIDHQFDRIDRNLDKQYKQVQDRLRKTLKGKALSAALRKAETAHDDLSDQADRARDKATNAANKAAAKAQQKAIAATQAQRVALAALVEQQKNVKDQYDAATQSLTDLRQAAVDYASGVRDAVTASGSLSTLAQSGATSLSALLQKRQKALDQAKQFAADLTALTAAGLNTDDIQDLEAQGPSALKTADAIAKGGPAAIAQMNALQAQLKTTGQQLGDSTAHTLYDAGVTAAQGLVDGLAAQQATLTAQATALGQQIAAGIAAGMAAASAQANQASTKLAGGVIKSAKGKLKSHSPSLVFRDLGRDVTQGLVLGLDETYVTRRASRFAAALEQGFNPNLSAAAAEPKATQFRDRTVPLIGTVHMQPGESVGVLAARLDFLERTRS